MLTLIKGGTVYAPEPLGQQDILIGGGKILKIAAHLDPYLPYDIQIIDAAGMLVFPGLIDGHVHILGGGGEGGYRTRTPEIMLSQIITGGVTTLIGCLGTDGSTRTMSNLVAKARGLCEEGVTCYTCTGSYQIPVRTLTGSITDDLILIDRVIGCGEIAISDHRSSQPSFAEFARVAADTRLGGILSGKAGVVNVHMGDGPAGLSLLRRIVQETEIPPHQLLPTHINRSRTLMLDGIDYAKSLNGYLDLTTSFDPDFLEEDELTASAGYKLALDSGVDPAHVTYTSDGQGSIPLFDSERNYIGLGVGEVSSLYRELCDTVQKENLPLETALLPVTKNPAALWKLTGKGALREGWDADIVLAQKETFSIHGVFAMGQTMMLGGELCIKGTFENH